MTQEALKLAIQLRDTASGYWTENEIPIIEKLIELLAQTQEPVALQYPQKDIDWQREQQIKAQASTPPQRTWVGLTRMELIKCGVLPFGMSYELCQAIEAKLKELNA